MMDFKKVVAEISNSLKEDSSESVKTGLESINREFSTMQTSLAVANNESRDRKEQIRTLQEKLDDAEAKVTKLSDTTQVTAMKEEYENKLEALQTDSATKTAEFEEEKTQLLAAQGELHGIFKTEVQADLMAIKDLPAFEKIKGNLKLPALKEDKSFDFETYESKDVLFTKAKLVEYKNLGLFGDTLNVTNAITPIVKKVPENVDIVKLAGEDPVAARKWLDARRHKNPLYN